jgi:tetratricopeptide (TPR) repeat protein
MHLMVGTLLRNPVDADAALRTACEGFQRWHPQRVDEIINCAYERAWLADDRGDAAVALAEMRIAARNPDDQQRGTIAATYVDIATRNDAEKPIEKMQSAAAELSKLEQWWVRGDAADAYVAAALGWDRLGKKRDAERCWSAALTILEPIDQPYFGRRLARVRAALARHRIATRPLEAQRLAIAALDWYRAAGGYDAAVSELAAVATPR